MKSEKLNFLRWTALLASVVSLIWLSGCSKDNSIVDPGTGGGSSVQQALQKIAENDEAVASFAPNYNEDDAMSFALGKVNTAVYPVHVGQKMLVVNTTFESNVIGDTAYGKLTKEFKGVLIIAGSYTKSADGKVKIDTIITKNFNTTITRRLKYIKVDSTENPEKNWKVVAVSLPEGGTLTSGIKIAKLTLAVPDSSSFVITSPNDFYLAKQPGKNRHMPFISRSKAGLTMRVEIVSAYADTDFVTLTHGAALDGFGRGMHRAKIKFHLISSTPEGSNFRKVYEAAWSTHQYMGYFHAVVNAYPKASINDDKAAVEVSSWGVPYAIK